MDVETTVIAIARDLVAEDAKVRARAADQVTDVIRDAYDGRPDVIDILHPQAERQP